MYKVKTMKNWSSSRYSTDESSATMGTRVLAQSRLMLVKRLIDGFKDVSPGLGQSKEPH